MIPQRDAVKLLRQMLLIRRFEEATIQLWEELDIEGHRHVYIGQEAIAAVVCDLMRDDDAVTTTHRNHGHVVARGGDLGRALAEILGRADGYNLGRAGSPGITAADVGFIFTTGQVGGGIGLGTGASLAQKVAGKGGISVAFFGDGALEEGVAFESMNMAALHRLPVLYVCENNSVGITTGRAENEWSSSSLSAATLGNIPRSLEIETAIVAGEDVESLYYAAKPLVERLRAGDAPAFIETRSHRWPGSRSFNPTLVAGTTDLAWITDPATVTGEHADWTNTYDPLVCFGRTLLERGHVDADSLAALDADVASVISVARAFALASPEPQPESFLTGLYA